MIGLVVAPSAIAARIVEQLVLRAGCSEVRSFPTASDAEAAVRTDLKPALLATEWDLPDRSGLELAGAVRDAMRRSDFPVLLIGTRNTRDDVLEALEAGIDIYVLKPIDPDVFVARATALLREEAARLDGDGKGVGATEAVGAARATADATDARTEEAAEPVSAADATAGGTNATAGAPVDADRDDNVEAAAA